MTLRLFGRFLPSILVLAIAGCAQLSPISLFDGATLAGWNALGEANWRVSGGELVADGPREGPDGVTPSGSGDGFLVTTRRYTSYSLSVEFNPSADTNSGVFIHCADPETIDPTSCYEINIWDDHPRQEFRTGAIVTKVLPLKKMNSAGQWNRYDISAAPDRIRAGGAA